MVASVSAPQSIESLLGSEAENLLTYQAKVSKDQLHLPGPDWVERIFAQSDRSPQVLRSLQQLYGTGQLANTGYLSILPVDQGIEHSAAASFAPNPIYFDPENIVKLAIAGGCNAVATTLGVLGMTSRRYAHKIPFIVKINHSELLSYPNAADQIMFASVEQAWNLGAVAVGATIYFGSPESNRQIQEVRAAFARAHELGMATILWCYLRNDAFKQDKDYHLAADLTGQANHLGVTIEADIIKQKLPETNGGYQAVAQATGEKYGRTDDRVYSELSSDHPIDLTRYQVLNCYAGRAGLINSGGSSGKNDFAEAVRTAVINKRAGGCGLISGRKTFQRDFKEGVKLFHLIQSVYLSDDVTIA
ncbi:MAG: class I fructose-bisphosphate aldolase [Leptolyngbyaceae cyanobacterium SM1_1_3]|nr:class I fructose-bisphosphate aldolase [Leptolyngbyaceae cyanobacterium SM1_1_3]NJN04523.1 class I fructose-bisphosphate aldolase [Leptolyngbyaceae cyanobacterium RM1_1_2]NJO08396.1 class I fructose-bisphosphate aldolase [Leptolyngbyaceae cyanobacterium SL_1_1]